MAAKFTPGPWEAHPTVDADGFGYVRSPSGWVATIEGSSEEEVLDTARLIAAAPDLYDAVAMLVEVIGKDWDFIPEAKKILRFARKTMKKVDGK